MKKTIILSLFLACLFSCEKNRFDNTCGVDDPVEELAWLRDQIAYIEQMDTEASQYYYFRMAKYNGVTVFLPGNCNPAINMVSAVLDCSGERIGIIGDGEDMIGWDELTDMQLLWHPENTACNFR
jgi:hypothetical protein